MKLKQRFLFLSLIFLISLQSFASEADGGLADNNAKTTYQAAKQNYLAEKLKLKGDANSLSAHAQKTLISGGLQLSFNQIDRGINTGIDTARKHFFGLSLADKNELLDNEIKMLEKELKTEALRTQKRQTLLLSQQALDQKIQTSIKMLQLGFITKEKCIEKLKKYETESEELEKDNENKNSPA